MVPTTVLVAGSIWVTKLLTSQLVIQTAVVPVASPPHGTAGGVIEIVASILFVTSLIRMTEPLFGMPTQMLPEPSVSQFGPDGPVGPTGIVTAMVFLSGSIRETLPSCVLAVQTAPLASRTPFG